MRLLLRKLPFPVTSQTTLPSSVMSLVYTAQSYASQTICQKHVTLQHVYCHVHVKNIEQHMVLTQKTSNISDICLLSASNSTPTVQPKFVTCNTVRLSKF